MVPCFLNLADIIIQEIKVFICPFQNISLMLSQLFSRGGQKLDPPLPPPPPPPKKKKAPDLL